MKGVVGRNDVLACLLLVGAVGVFFIPLWLAQAMLPTGQWTAGYHLAIIGFAREELALGHGLPLWNPYVYGGIPFYPIITAYIAFPVYWLYLLLPPLLAARVVVTIPFFVAAASTYLYCRYHNIAAIGAVVASLSFAMGGLFLDQFWHGHRDYISTLALLPLLLLALDRLIARPTLGRAATLGACYGFVVVQTPTPQYAAILLVALGLRWLFESVGLVWRRQSAAALRLAVALGASMAVAAAIGAVSLLPSAELMGLVEMAGDVDYSYLTYGSVHPLELAGLAFPDVFGHEMNGDFWRGLYCETPLYSGVLPALLAVFGLSRWRRDRMVAFVSLLAFVGLLIALGKYTPLYRFVALVPPFTFVRDPARFAPLFTFGLAVLAAKGVEVAFLRPNSDLHPAVKWLTYALAAVWAMVAVVLLFGASGADFGLLAHVADRLAGFDPLLGVGVETRRNMLKLIGRLAEFDPLRVVGAPLVIGLISLALLWVGQRISTNGRRVVLAAVVAGVFVDLTFFGAQFIRPAAVDVLFPDKAFLAQLPRGAASSRVYPDGSALGEWESLALRVPNVGGLSPFGMKRYVDMLRAAYVALPSNESPGYLAPASVGQEPDPRIMDMLDVGYFVRSAEVGSAGGETVSARTPSLPRVRLVADYDVAPSPDVAIAVLKSAGFDPRRRVVLPTPPSVGGLGPLGDDDGACIVAYLPNSVVVQTRAAGTAILVLADAYHPGWRIFVDGVETAVLRVNHGLLAGVVPAGEHNMEFVFRPMAFYVGAAISAAAWLFVAGLGVAHLLRRGAHKTVA